MKPIKFNFAQAAVELRQMMERQVPAIAKLKAAIVSAKSDKKTPSKPAKPAAPTSRRQSAARPAPEPKVVEQLSIEAAVETLGLEPETLKADEHRERLQQWNVWGTNRLMEHEGDKAAAKEALIQDLLRDPANRPVLVRQLKKWLVAQFESGELPAKSVDEMLQFIDQNKHTLLPQWMEELLRNKLSGREELFARLVQLIEERLYGGDADKKHAAAREEEAQEETSGARLLRGRLRDGSLGG